MGYSEISPAYSEALDKLLCYYWICRCFFKAHFKLSLSATSSNFASETVLTIIGGVAFIITGVRLSRALERERLITIFEFFNRALIEISNIEDAAKRREEFGDSLKAYGCTVLMLFFCICGIFANRAAYPWDERSWIEFGTALITCITLVALAAYLGARSRFNRVSMDTPQALKLDDFLWIPGILGFLWAFYKVVSP